MLVIGNLEENRLRLRVVCFILFLEEMITTHLKRCCDILDNMLCWGYPYPDLTTDGDGVNK